MKRLLLGAMGALMLIGALTPTALADEEGHYPQPHEEFAAWLYCLQSYDVREDAFGTTDGYWVPILYTVEGESAVEDLAIKSAYGCVTTILNGIEEFTAEGYVHAHHLSDVAAYSQCQWLEETQGVTYPYAFYDEYVANDRFECTEILLGLHTGALAPVLPPEDAPTEGDTNGDNAGAAGTGTTDDGTTDDAGAAGTATTDEGTTDDGTADNGTTGDTTTGDAATDTDASVEAGQESAEQ